MAERDSGLMSGQMSMDAGMTGSQRGVPPVVRGRFAPSPSGRMHLGNAFAALISWLSARSQGGEWLLRIEDIDPQRSRQEYADQIMRDLEWLGLTWDGTPAYQSQHTEIYEDQLRKLSEKGLLYPCRCTRADILATQAPHESDGRVVYKGNCRPKPGERYVLNHQASPDAALRVMVPDGEAGRVNFVDGHYGWQSVQLQRECGDFIVRRRDGAWAYQLAVVSDDCLMGITEVVRGRDLLLSSPQQIWLARQLDLTPPSFAHFPLLVNAAGQRLSKRDMSLDLGALRQRFSAAELLGQLAHAANLLPAPIPVSATELLSASTSVSATELLSASTSVSATELLSASTSVSGPTHVSELLGQRGHAAAISAAELLPLFSWDKIPLDGISM